ncbi:MAG TPA: ABC transporter ATP-binding protein [Acidimicrobiia bacterium]|nr:ABC transporter ATP-binding protein [Acidimicrobiia bacterium]
MLEVNGLAAGYGKAQALFDIDLHVDEGEIVTILGPNGAGKTTLVNSIAGVIRPTSGSVVLDGADLLALAPHQISSKGVALVPEGRRIFPRMTVTDNLDIGAYGRDARPDRDENMKWVHEIFPRLAERAGQEAGTLSGGEQQMLAIGRALMSRPKLLLLDEPSLGLAPIIVSGIFEVLRDINEAGVSILIVEQNVVEALDLASRGYVLEEGHIVGEDDSESLLHDERLRKAYLGL